MDLSGLCSILKTESEGLVMPEPWGRDALTPASGSPKKGAGGRPVFSLKLLEMAARASLAFLGQEDVILSSEPQVTYFVEQYKGWTPFAQRVDAVNFEQNWLSFGSEAWARLPHIGDLVTDMYLKLTFPVDALGSSSTVRDSVGTLMIHSVELYVGSELVERLWGEHLALTWDLEVPESKQGSLLELIGKGTTVAATNYTVPLPFTVFTKGLPMCAFKEDVTVRLILHPSSVFTNPPLNLNSQIKANLDVEFTYLSDPEIDFVKKNPQLYVFEQVQKAEFFLPRGVNQTTCPLNFVNPVKEMFFVIQNDTAGGYDYSNVTGGTTDQLTSMVLFFNSTDRISSDIGTPVFLRNLQALEFHTRQPDYLFYMYSFSLDPESDIPTGHVNFSRIDKQNLILNLNPSLANRYVTIYAVSYNFFLVQDASAQVLFKNFTS